MSDLMISVSNSSPFLPSSLPFTPTHLPPSSLPSFPLLPPFLPPSMQSAMDLWQKNLSELEGKYRITNKILLTKSSIVLLVVILLFFLSNTIPNVELELGKPL